MKILGFYIGGHDSNVTFVDSNGECKYFKLERIIQSKHKKGDFGWVKSICEKHGFVPDFVCFSDGNRNNLGICDKGKLWKKLEPFKEFENAETYCLDHHYAHILSVFPVIGDMLPKYGVCVDGKGDYQVKCSVILDPFDFNKSKTVYASKNDCFCLLFNKIGKYMNLTGGELDFAGKIMGAQSYGNIDYSYVAELEKQAEERNVAETLEMKYQGENIVDICKVMNQKFYNWLATYHYWVGKRINKILSENISGNCSIAYAGGAAQNTVYNFELEKKYDIFIPPHSYDGGISIGCAHFGGMLLDMHLNMIGFPFCSGEDDLGYASNTTVNEVANLLSDGKIVGWCQGKSEIGPRALGHRSILMNPSINNGNYILNSRVKHREPWRPFAASILQDDAEKITEESRERKYMLHAVKVNSDFKSNLSSAVHVDGTCRIQTVKDTENLHTFYKLISMFKKKTGVCGILNTSYNVSGMPIASSREDVLRAYDYLDIDALCIGDEIMVRKR